MKVSEMQLMVGLLFTILGLFIYEETTRGDTLGYLEAMEGMDANRIIT